MGSRAGEISLDFGGELRLFRLGVGELRRLQEETGAGPLGLATRCALSLAALKAIGEQDFAGLARIGQGPLAEPPQVRFGILQGLLGAGVPAPEATKVVKTWVDERPFAEVLPICYQLCLAAIMGPEEEPLGEGQGEGASLSPKDASPSRTSTASAPSPA